MPVLTALWTIMRAYQPRATRERKARRFGAFKPTFAPPAWHRAPKSDREAQRLYNHIRTCAFYLDAAPVLSDLGLPFRAGLDDIISLVPLYGDIVSGILQLYQVFLCWLFGVPAQICGMMFLNVILDVLVGIVPIIGDVLDNLFKSNLRNLQLLEKYLLSAEGQQRYHILLMPDTTTFLPEPKTPGSASSTTSRLRAWFGMNYDTPERQEELEAERATGHVRQTRRMRLDEAGFAFRDDGGTSAAAQAAAAADEPPPYAYASARANGSQAAY